MLTRIVEQLQNSRSILVSTHSMPDGNALCSLLALGLVLKLLQKRVYLHFGKRIPPEFKFLPSVGDVVHEIDRERDFDTAVILNCPDFADRGLSAILQSRSPVLINIDYHRSNTGFGDLQLLDPKTSGTTELVYRIIKKLLPDINRQIATAIYTGILADTDSFQSKGTNSAAYGISAEMINLGVRPDQIAGQLYGSYPLSHVKLLNRAIDSLEIRNDGKVSIVTLTRENFEDARAQFEDVDSIIDSACRIKGVELAALIKESLSNWTCSVDRRRSFQVSLHSKGSVNVAEIAAGFGGSGTGEFAGFHSTATLSELKARIVNQFENITNACLDGQTKMNQNRVADVAWPAVSRASVG